MQINISKQIVVVIWIASTLFSIPIMISTVFSTAYHKRLDKHVNVCYSKFEETWQLSYLFISLFVFYLLPCLLLFFFYGSIVYVIKKRDVNYLTASERFSETSHGTKEYDSSVIESDSANKTTLGNRSRTNHSLKVANQKDIIGLLIVMAFLIMLLHLPFRVFSIWAALASKEQLIGLGINNYYALLNFCRVAFYMNSAINPIFYHILSSKFQKALKESLRVTRK